MDTEISPALGLAFKAGFIRMCIEAIRLGYDRMLVDSEYKLDWDEDTITNSLITSMRRTGYLRDNGIAVNLQVPIVTADIASGNVSFIAAAKVDFKLSIWPPTLDDELEYFAEAKNLSENDWTKSTGKRVRASKYRKRYITTGIENYLTGRYPEGCLVGYVVNGCVTSVVAGLNNLIQSKGLSPRIGQLAPAQTASWSAHYHSDNIPHTEDFPLIHLLLQLT